MTDSDRVQIAISALESVRLGLTSEGNKVWPTVKNWTKKERDEAMLTIVRDALRRVK